MNKNYQILTLIVALFFTISCKKKNIVCEENCYQIELKGKVTNGVTKVGEPNIPLIIERGKRGAVITIFNPVKVFTSSDNGLVFTSLLIDSSMFKNDYYLRVWVKKNENFIAPNTKNNFEYLYDINSNDFKNINFKVYPKAKLIVTIKRTLNDSFLSYSINGIYDNNSIDIFYTDSQINFTQKEFSVETSADIFTKIYATKRFNNGQSVIKTDSIKCLNGANNILELTF